MSATRLKFVLQKFLKHFYLKECFCLNARISLIFNITLYALLSEWIYYSFCSIINYTLHCTFKIFQKTLHLQEKSATLHLHFQRYTAPSKKRKMKGNACFFSFTLLFLCTWENTFWKNTISYIDRFLKTKKLRWKTKVDGPFLNHGNEIAIF